MDVRQQLGIGERTGGRHRAPTFAGVLAERLRSEGYRVSVTHRDLHRPVVQR
ncbi:hypothetical protein ACIQUY_32820 [Streptomyces sp. NPDC090231]|uniref:RapZ C-terminal domain-containing protein n=1 Tax=Streptomyces sp. NPDC090231 TaxID=3365958 RepID=UPI0037F84D8B